MNLINDTWIPVRRKSGTKAIIAPWQITDDLNKDPIIEFAAARPDFNGALVQFLIGLLQTVCPPKGNKEWQEWFKNPPSPEQLKVKFNQVAGAFNLDGDGPRFMQEMRLPDEETKSIEMLLLGFPQINTCKLNRDHFIKRDQIKCLCDSCTAIALYALQLNAPANSYLRSGIRYGGPITTVIMGEHLWQHIWLNVINENEFQNLCDVNSIDTIDIFPWMHNNSNEDKIKTNRDINSAQMYWAMPRRISIKYANNETAEQCGICGVISPKMAYRFNEGIHGISYDGIFEHPLTPQEEKKPNKIRPKNANEIIGYKNWLGYVVNFNDKFFRNKPALVVSKRIDSVNSGCRLWAFGFHMKNMNVIGWNEGVMPDIQIEQEYKEAYSTKVICFIKSAEKVCSVLKEAIKEGWYTDKKIKAIRKNRSKNAILKTTLVKITEEYWKNTEWKFYKIMNLVRDKIKRNEDDLKYRNEWKNYIIEEAKRLFNENIQIEQIGMVDSKRIAKAWNKLKKLNYDIEIKRILGLPEKEV